MESVKTAFTAQMQDELFRQEDASWWFQYRARLICRFVKRYMPEVHIWDIGGGNGYTTKALQDSGIRCTLLEPSDEACKNAARRGVHDIICGTLNSNTEPNSIEGICLLDVLEHIDEDAEFLHNAYKALKSTSGGGVMLITVPARQELWSYADEDAGHFRRYSYKSLQQKAHDAGFAVEYVTYFFGFLYLPIFCLRKLKGTQVAKAEGDSTGDGYLVTKTGIVQRCVQAVCQMEYVWLSRWRLPIGSSLLCILRKA